MQIRGTLNFYCVWKLLCLTLIDPSFYCCCFPFPLHILFNPRRENICLVWRMMIPVLIWFIFFLNSEITDISFLLFQVSDDSLDSPEPEPVTCMEPFLVRRLSCRTVQLPPLVFRQAEQYYCDRKPEPDTVTAPPRPTTLPLRTPPLIAITSADTSR